MQNLLSNHKAKKLSEKIHLQDVTSLQRLMATVSKLEITTHNTFGSPVSSSCDCHVNAVWQILMNFTHA